MTIRSPEIERVVLDRLSKGDPLAVIARDEGMPHPSTWRGWCADDNNLAIAYAHARDDGFDVLAAEGLDILDEEPERVTTTSGEDRVETRIDGASVQRAKNRFEGRLKLLAKWDPKRYGDATMLKHADADGEKLDLANALALRRQQVANGKQT
jgi:intein/homing endonuclease